MDNNYPEVAPGLWVSEDPGQLVILNPNTGRIFVGDQAGALAWKSLSEGQGIDVISDQMAQAFGMQPEEAKQKVSNFVGDLYRARLVQRARNARAPNRVFLPLRALLEFALYDLTNMCFGFRRACGRAGCGCCQRRTGCPGVAEEIFRSVNLAACFYHKPVRCLQRSVVTVRLLRQYGIDCRLVIAYRLTPFLMHAWPEVNGQIANDLPGFAEQLRVLRKL